MGQKPDIIQELEQDLGVEMEQTSLEELWERGFSDKEYGLFCLDETGAVVGLRLNQFCPPPVILAKFNTLRRLYLRGTFQNVTPLSSMTALTHLHLDCQMYDVSPLASLTALTALTQLYLWGKQIQDLSPLASLTALTLLELGNNQIQDLSPLASLTALTLLELGNNQIQELSPLAFLTALTQLGLENNQIQDLSPLASLTALTQLELRNNQIQAISPLASLTALTQLDLRCNQIQDLSPLEGLARTGLSWLWVGGHDATGISIADNPLQRPPLEIARQGHGAISAWLDAQRETQRELNEVKLLLVGAGGSGKTSLLKALQQQQHDPHESQTHGIRIEHWLCDCDGRQVQVRLWDFGGQEIMHATHQFFMSEHSLYVLVVDGRKEEAQELYWLKLIESFGATSPVLVVINKIDENPGFELNRRSLLEKFPNIVGFYRISCRNDAGIKDLRLAVAAALNRMELITQRWPDPWFQVKQHLETCGRDYVGHDEYREICCQHGVLATNQQDALLGYLHALGVSLHFSDLEWLNTQVLNPVWITNPIYALINHPQLAGQFGVVAHSQLPALLPDFPKDRLAYLIRLMEKFQICHPLGSDKLLVPDLLAVAMPELDFKPSMPLCLSVVYYFLPTSILQRLMVQRHSEIVESRQWRTGMVLRHPLLACRAQVRADYAERRIQIQLDGPNQREYLGLILDSLRQIHKDFHKIKPQEMLRCPCSLCRESSAAHEFDYAQVQLFQEKGRQLPCPKSAELVSLERLIEKTYVKPRSEAELMVDLANLRAVHKDKQKFREMVLILLKDVLQQEQASRHDLDEAIERAWQLGLLVQPKPDLGRPAAFLCVATEWDSGKGGLSTFNRELCVALAAAGNPTWCLVPELVPAQQQQAQAAGVTLIAPPQRTGMSAESQLLAKLDLPADVGPFWVVGHDRITGPQAAARVADGGYAGFIFVAHTIPNEIEWFKHENGRDPMREAETRDDLQLQLALQAKLVVAVGPRIHEHMEHLLHGVDHQVPLLRLDPGLAPFANPGTPVKKRSCLLLGRAEDDHLKGLDIAARALGQLDEHKVTLVIRGAATGTGAALKQKLEELANNSEITVHPQEYTSQREKIDADLRRATLVLMPSRTEGFGLVGLEAIAAGIPVLVSANSGLAQLLNELDGPNHKAVVPVTDDEETDSRAWARKIDIILDDPQHAFHGAQALYNRLAGKLTWQKAAKTLCENLPGQ